MSLLHTAVGVFTISNPIGNLPIFLSFSSGNRRQDLADWVQAVDQRPLAARLFPYDDRSIRPPDREGWIRLAVAELSYFDLGSVARHADRLVQILNQFRRVERVALAGLRLGRSLAGLVQESSGYECGLREAVAERCDDVHCYEYLL